MSIIFVLTLVVHCCGYYTSDTSFGAIKSMVAGIFQANSYYHFLTVPIIISILLLL